MTRPLRATTITAASSLLRSSPPLSGASVLSALRLAPLGCRDHRPDVSAALTTVAFDQSGPRWLGISDLIAEPEGPTFISYKVARSRFNRLRFVTQDPERKSRAAHTIVISRLSWGAKMLFGISAWTPRTMSTTWVTRKLAATLQSA